MKVNQLESGVVYTPMACDCSVRLEGQVCSYGGSRSEVLA
jgi:hypothetical protein